MHHAVEQAAGQFAEDILGLRRCEFLQNGGNDVDGIFRQQIGSFFGRPRLGGQRQFAVFVGCRYGSLKLFVFHRHVLPVSHGRGCACGEYSEGSRRMAVFRLKTLYRPRRCQIALVRPAWFIV